MLAKTTAAKHVGDTTTVTTVAVHIRTAAMTDWQFYLVLLRELWPLLVIFAVAFALVVVFVISVWRAFKYRSY